MKLAMVWGSFNPPVKGDRILFDALAKHAGHDTECLIVTDTLFNDDHPMGVLEKNEVLSGIISSYIKVRMDCPTYPGFFNEIEGKYDEIIFLTDSGKSTTTVRKALERWSKTPVVVQKVECGDIHHEKALLIGALKIQDYDLFQDHYGGPDVNNIHVWNTLKDRVIWKGGSV